MNQEEITKKIDSAVSELVYRKTSLIKAYRYYNAERDADQFKHLEENYGIGTPTQIEFTPLVRKHIDALVGEYMSVPTRPKISCKDKGTLNNIMRDVQLKIKAETMNFYKSKLNSSILEAFKTDKPLKEDPAIANEAQQLISDLNANYTSEYEMASQNILKYIQQSRDIDFETKKAALAKDLYITGTAYYRTYKTENGDQLNFEVLNPIHTFIDRNSNSVYLKNSYRSVIRRYMHKIEILNKYNAYLTPSIAEAIKNIDAAAKTGDVYYVRSSELLGSAQEGVVAGLEITPGLPTENNGYDTSHRLIEVFEVEWLDVEKEDGKYVMYRYEGIKINGNIYIPIGKVEEIQRSCTTPTQACLSVNGMFFSDRNGKPFSLVLATAPLQDRLDMLIFYRDNVFSAAGVKGDFLDISMLPTFLGANVTERIMKYYAYKKQMGIGIVDSSQEGRTFNDNTTLSGFDNSLRGDVVQAFDYAIQSIENTCCSITGVSRERIGGITQHDAVSNVEVGVRMSAIISKPYYQLLDTLMKEVLTDCLNLAKIVYKDGLTGTIILGEKQQKIFTALPEYYTTTDFDVHVNDSSEITKDIETIRMFVQELIKAQILDPQTAADSLDAKSLTELKSSIANGLKAQEDKNGMAQQMQQQLEQSKQQLDELNKQLQKVTQELEASKKKDSEDKSKMENDKLDLEWYKAKESVKSKDKEIKIKSDQVQAEVLQLYDGNKNNDEIKNI